MPYTMESHRRREAIAIVKFHSPEWAERNMHRLGQVSTETLEQFAQTLADVAWLARFTDEHGHNGEGA